MTHDKADVDALIARVDALEHQVADLTQRLNAQHGDTPAQQPFMPTPGTMPPTAPTTPQPVDHHLQYGNGYMHHPYPAQPPQSHMVEETGTPLTPTPPRTSHIESFIGRYVLAGLAAILILAAAGTLVAYIWGDIPNMLKFAVISLIAVALTAGGLILARRKPHTHALYSALVGTGGGLGYLAIISAGTYLNLFSPIVVLIITALWTAALVGATLITRDIATYLIISIGVLTTTGLAKAWVTTHATIAQLIMIGLLVTLYCILLWAGGIITLQPKHRWTVFGETWFVATTTAIIFTTSTPRTPPFSYTIFALIMLIIASIALMIAAYRNFHKLILIPLIILALISISTTPYDGPQRHLTYISILITLLWWAALAGVTMTLAQRRSRNYDAYSIVVLISLVITIGHLFATVDTHTTTGSPTIATIIGVITLVVFFATIAALIWYATTTHRQWVWPLATASFIMLLHYPTQQTAIAITAYILAIVTIYAIHIIGEHTVFSPITTQHATLVTKRYHDANQGLIAITVTALFIGCALTMKNADIISGDITTLSPMMVFILLVVTRVFLPGGWLSPSQLPQRQRRSLFGGINDWVARIAGPIAFIIGLFTTTGTIHDITTWVFIITYLGWLAAYIYQWKDSDTKGIWSIIAGLSSLITILTIYYQLTPTTDLSPIPSVLALLIGMGCVFTGFAAHLKPLRLFGLITIIAAVLKLVAFDIDAPNTLMRIIMLMLGGIIVFAVSVGYTMWEKRISKHTPNQPIPAGQPQTYPYYQQPMQPQQPGEPQSHQPPHDWQPPQQSSPYPDDNQRFAPQSDQD